MLERGAVSHNHFTFCDAAIQVSPDTGAWAQAKGNLPPLRPAAYPTRCSGNTWVPTPR